MQAYQQEFIEFALSTNVLKFGEFTLKSGRISPYFFNSGLFNTGERLRRLGEFYAAALEHSGVQYDCLYGPAYKGIPLVSTLSIALAGKYQKDYPYAFNRKEKKDHGEGGVIVGAELSGKVLIIDDVISAGTSVRESFDLIQAQGAQTAGVLIALDRQERGQGEQSAIQEIEAQYGIPVISIISLSDLMDYLQDKPAFADHSERVRAYREQFGV